jgi:hypothetical protein
MDRLHKILSLLGIDKLEEADKKEVYQVFESIIDEQVNERFENDEEKTKELCENILNHIDQKTDEMFESDSTINLFSVVNACKSLSGDSAKLAGLIVGLLAYISNESKYLSISKSLVSNTSSANENAELHLYKRIQGLTTKQQTFMLEMLEGCSVEEVDKRFDVLLRESASDKQKHTCVCPHCEHETESTKECSLVECPECGESKMKTKTNEGLGVTEVGKTKQTVSPFLSDIEQYQNILKS